MLKEPHERGAMHFSLNSWRVKGLEDSRLALDWLLGFLVLAGLYASSRYNYLLFHVLAELFSAVIGCGIFMIAWNTRRLLKNDYLMLLGIAFLFVAILDLTHALAYQGMRILPGDSADPPTQLWIAARMLESLSLVLAPSLLHRQVKLGWLFLAYIGATALLLVSILVWHIFPACYIDGVGLTLFKRLSEYGICAALLAAIGLLLRHRQAFDRHVLAWLVWAIVLTIASELAFTSYVNVYGPANLMGHFLKILSFYLVYKAIIVTGLSKPYALLLREQKLVEEELERLVQERTATLQETTDQLNAVVHSIAHDLRAPIRAQHGFASLLLQEYGAVLGPEGRQWVDKISSAAGRLDTLVFDLLRYAKVSQDRPPLARLDLAQVVEEVRQGLAAEVGRTGGSIDVTRVSGEVLGDGESLHIALQNLVSNALKFTRAGERPKVRLWTEPRDGCLRVWVEDNGIGIAPQYQGKLFRVFNRLHHGQEYPGTGIGLALVKKSVERIGGQVGVESGPGHGSRFWMELKAASR